MSYLSMRSHEGARSSKPTSYTGGFSEECSLASRRTKHRT